jgi:hypothetical protein
MRTHTIVFLAIFLFQFFGSHVVQSEPAADRVEVYGIICTEIEVSINPEFSDIIPYPVYFARVMFITGSDTISTFSNRQGQYHINFIRPEPSIVEDQSADTPYAFRLHQNYPNPFNPSTVISYQLSKATEVSLTIYSVTGQNIRLLDSGQKSAGDYSIVWNGRDDQGRSVGAGVYLYRLQAGKYTESRKMLLLDGGGINHNSNKASFPTQGSGKPTITLPPYEIVVLRDGYAPYRETGFTLPETGREIEKNITIENRSSLDNYFPLDTDNTWNFISARQTNMLTANPEDLISEQAFRVTGTQVIEGKEYAVLSHWTPFLPEAFHNDIVLPLVRISDDGYFILRYGDVEFPLYRFRDPNYSPFIDLEEWIGLHSKNPDAYSDLYNRIKGIVITTSMPYYDEQVMTPAGAYDDCRRIELEEDRSSIGGGILHNTLWFGRGVGPVYAKCPGDSIAPIMFLKRATIAGKNYGVLPGVCESSSVTDTDLKEMFRLAFSEMRRYIWEYSISFPGMVIPVACDAEYAALLPEINGFPLVFHDLESLKVMERQEKSYLFITISENYDPARIDISGVKVSVPLTVFHEVIDCSGYLTEFQRKFDMWIGSIPRGWICKAAKNSNQNKNNSP